MNGKVDINWIGIPKEGYARRQAATTCRSASSSKAATHWQRPAEEWS
jgi:hypothetical protein